MKIAIIGQGYVGQSITQAALHVGHSVIGFDINPGALVSLSFKGNYRGTTDPASIGDVEVVVIGNGIVVTATEVDDVVATITAVAGAEVLTGMFAFTGFRQTNFPATLVQTNGALFVPESAPALEHFCPAFAAESDVTGIAKNSDTNPMATADLKFVFITPLYAI